MEEKAKHTPGPYKKVEHSWKETSIYSAAGERLCLLNIEDYGDITEDNQDAFEAIVSAQADLFAAAPDMLEALGCCLTRFAEYEAIHLSKGTEEGKLKAESNRMMAMMLQGVIAKAEGRS